MRRPLKPFVTEYKSNNRRPKDGTGAFGMEAEAPLPEASGRKASQQASATRPAKPSVRRGDTPRESTWANDTTRFGNGQGEDSYEAALRAADALFSNPLAPVNSARDVPSSAIDVFAKSGAEPPSPSAGRILRAIDETPDTTLADIEAERAPKRRGRKPGSKNKPKIPVALQAPLPTLNGAPEAGDDHEDDLVADDGAADDGTPASSFPLSTRHPIRLPSSPNVYPTILSRGDRRFAWVRTKLGPGEQWKRRLPKIIW